MSASIYLSNASFARAISRSFSRESSEMIRSASICVAPAGSATHFCSNCFPQTHWLPTKFFALHRHISTVPMRCRNSCSSAMCGQARHAAPLGGTANGVSCIVMSCAGTILRCRLIRTPYPNRRREPTLRVPHRRADIRDRPRASGPQYRTPLRERLPSLPPPYYSG